MTGRKKREGEKDTVKCSPFSVKFWYSCKNYMVITWIFTHTKFLHSQWVKILLHFSDELGNHTVIRLNSFTEDRFASSICITISSCWCCRWLNTLWTGRCVGLNIGASVWPWWCCCIWLTLNNCQFSLPKVSLNSWQNKKHKYWND